MRLIEIRVKKRFFTLLITTTHLFERFDFYLKHLKSNTNGCDTLRV